MVFLFPLTAHTAKCFLVLSYPITPATKSFLDISSCNKHSIFRLFSYISSSRQVHSTKSVELFLTFHRRIFIRRTLHPLHQSVMLLSRPVFPHLFFQIFPFHHFCNNHTNKPIILIATCTMIYSSLMRSTRQNISSFRPLPNNTQINAVISINALLHKT